MEKLTLKEVQEKTMKLLGTTNIEDVSYITQEMVDEDLLLPEENSDDDDSQEKELTTKYMYGHNMRYSNRRGSDRRTYQVYVYDRGTDKYNRSHGCKSDKKGRTLRQNDFNHWKDGDCTSKDARLKFKRK